MKRIHLVYYAWCLDCGERPWWVPARATDVRCDACGRFVDHFNPVLQRVRD